MNTHDGELHDGECIHGLISEWCSICNGRDRAERLAQKKQKYHPQVGLTYTLRKGSNEQQ